MDSDTARGVARHSGGTAWKAARHGAVAQLWVGMAAPAWTRGGTTVGKEKIAVPGWSQVVDGMGGGSHGGERSTERRGGRRCWRRRRRYGRWRLRSMEGGGDRGGTGGNRGETEGFTGGMVSGLIGNDGIGEEQWLTGRWGFMEGCRVEEETPGVGSSGEDLGQSGEVVLDGEKRSVVGSRRRGAWREGGALVAWRMSGGHRRTEMGGGRGRSMDEEGLRLGGVRWRWMAAFRWRGRGRSVVVSGGGGRRRADWGGFRWRDLRQRRWGLVVVSVGVESLVFFKQREERERS